MTPPPHDARVRLPFPFSDICALLSRLEEIETRLPPLLPKAKPSIYRDTLRSWFQSHRRRINHLDVNGRVALLSALLPARRTDRVYSLQAANLCRLLGRTLNLSAPRKSRLSAYQKAGNGDLATCLYRVIEESGPPAIPPVTLEEVDEMLELLAGGSRFSGPGIVKLPRGSSELRDQSVERVIKRCTAEEGKWLVRIVLKDLRPVVVDESVVLKSFHFLLPDLLRFQDDLNAALTLLNTELAEFPECPDARSERLHRRGVAPRLRPVVGTKISRPHFHKAFGNIDSLMKRLGSRNWVLERKYDGEYCEIHVDLTKSPDPAQCIKIFSKSGKDSTLDRKGIHKTLVQSLRLGTQECRFKKHAIFLGELVVFSDAEDCIMPFEEIRKHVSRSGVFIGTDRDSPSKAHEHLAIVFFDLLLLDEEIVMNRPINERRIWLRESYKKIHGRAIGAEWKAVSFSEPEKAKRSLLHQFAASNARRCEGLILKPFGVPYFSMEAPFVDYIKMKKDYMTGLGDELDFAVIGASYNAQSAATASRKPFIKWTTFHLGCLTNKEELEKYDARPGFKYVGVIDQEHCIPTGIFETANILGNLSAQPYDPSNPPRNFDIESPASVKMCVVFDKPLVFEVLGSSYEKPSNCNYLMLRHPRVKKLHEDRDWKECVTFQELQNQGRAARDAPVESESQETRRWIDLLESKCKRKFEQERMRSTPSRSTTSPHPISVLRSSPTTRVSRRIAPHDTITESPPASQKRAFKEQHSPSQPPPKRPCSGPKNPHEAEPLTEITNTANPRNRPATPSPPPLPPTTPQTSSPPSQTSRADSRSRCANPHSTCPLTNTTVLLAPCIAHTPYITETLLPRHATARTAALHHWDRDSSAPAPAHASRAATQPESPADAGWRKLVLVESMRRGPVRELVARLRGLNGGRFRERVEVWDWRVLEACEEGGHGVGGRGRRRGGEGWFLGALAFDEGRGRAGFVAEREWLREGG